MSLALGFDSPRAPLHPSAIVLRPAQVPRFSPRTEVLSFPSPFPGCNRLRALPSGWKCYLSFTTEVIDLFLPSPRHPIGETGGRFGVRCELLQWCYLTILNLHGEGHFVGTLTGHFSERMMESVAESLKKKLETSYVLNGSAISHQPLFSLHQFINYSYLCQAASAAGERVCKSHLFLQASVSLDFSWLVSSNVCFLMCSRKVANLQLIWLVFIIVLKAWEYPSPQISAFQVETRCLLTLSR